MILFGRRDIPFERDALGQFLPWLIAFMVYLAVLSTAGVLVLDKMAARWQQGVSDTLTVQIPRGKTAAEDSRNERVVLKILRETPEIARAEPLSGDDVMRLLEPWLGDLGRSADLPLPGLVDVELKKDTPLDSVALLTRLTEKVPGAAVDDHRVWLDHFVGLIESVEVLATAVLTLICVATVGTVIFTTRTGLAIHREAIEVLHFIGAQDSYVAGQFANRALGLGLRGGCIGLALAAPTLLGVGYLAGNLRGGILPDLTLSPLHWVALALLPVAVAGVAMVSAHLTVMKTLTRML